MRRTLAFLAVLPMIVAFDGPAQAAETEPPGTVLISTDIGGSSRISVSPGRIVWSGTSNGGRVLKSFLSSNGSSVVVGSVSTVGDSQSPFWGVTQGSSSGTRTLWGRRVGSVKVMATSGSSTVQLATSSVPYQVSGNRAVYRNSASHVIVYDFKTGKRLDVTDRYGTRINFNIGPDLFGNNLAFIAPDFSVRFKNLSNSAAPVVVQTKGAFSGAAAFAYGDWVAWDRSVDDQVSGDIQGCGLRNIRTMAPATTFDCGDGIADLTSSGVVYVDVIDPSHRTWSLRSSAGTVTPLPVPQSTHALAIDGNVMAWADADGLHAAPLADAPAQQPRSLGDPITSKTYKIGGSSWPFQLVTSASITKCHVFITKRGVLVRELTCNAGLLTQGEIRVHWDGRNSHLNPVGPGTFRWTAYATNDSRSMLRSDGAAKQTTGVLTVTN